MKKGLISVLTAAAVVVMVLAGCEITITNYSTAKITVKSTATKNTAAWNAASSHINYAAPGVHITWIYHPGYNADTGTKADLKKLAVMDGAQVRKDVVDERTHYVDADKKYQITLQVVNSDGEIWWATSDEFTASFYKEYTFTFDGLDIISSDTAITFPDENWVYAKVGVWTDSDSDGVIDSGEFAYAYPLVENAGSPGIDYDPNAHYGIGYAPKGSNSYNPRLRIQRPAQE